MVKLFYLMEKTVFTVLPTQHFTTNKTQVPTLPTIRLDAAFSSFYELGITLDAVISSFYELGISNIS